MADRLHLRVVSADSVVLDQMVHSVQIPGEDGSLGVLAGHLPMLCAVRDGIARAAFGDGQEVRFSLRDGIVQVTGSEITCLVSGAEVLSD